MNLPTSSPKSGTEPGEPVAIIRDEVQFPTPFRLRIAGILSRELPLRVKRLIDYTGAAGGLLLVAPVMLAVALLVRLESPGPVLFRQLRRGHRGRLFWVLKFRTMVVDAEQRLKDLEKRNESAGGVLFKMRDDPRVTRLGHLLRKYSLDELPQLINVLRGEMSLVGPRPLQIRDSDILESLNSEGYIRRLDVMPGLTGPWQVGGRSDVDHEHMVRLDVHYIENWSLRRDIWILFQTIWVVVAGRGAY